MGRAHVKLPKNHVTVVVSNMLAVLPLPPAVPSSGTSFSFMAMWPHTGLAVPLQLCKAVQLSWELAWKKKKDHSVISVTSLLGTASGEREGRAEVVRNVNCSG